MLGVKMVETYGARESCILIRRQVETEIYILYRCKTICKIIYNAVT